MSNITMTPLTFAEVNEKLEYNPETGKFTWRIDASKNIKAGAEAGTFKRARTDRDGRGLWYKYIRLNNLESPATRVAWLLHYGEWPDRTIQFKDGDTTNLRIDNLKLAAFKAVKGELKNKKTYKLSRDAQRHYGYKRYYGLSLAEYGEKLVAQGGVCAICGQPETSMLHGKVKPLSVDHSHKTGKIRELLCHHCNHLLGHAKDDRDILLKAAAYLEQHVDE